MLALFAIVWLRLLAACQDNLGARGNASSLDGDRALVALIAGSWCGTTTQGGPPESDGSHHAGGVCLHCATGCHGGVSRLAAWAIIVTSIAFGLGIWGRRHNPVAALEWATANRPRGPPPQGIGV